MYRDAQERSRNTLNGLQTTMQMQAQVSQNLGEDESVLADLVGKSQSAEGALQAMQAMHPLLALQAPHDRKSVVWGKGVCVRVHAGGGRILKKKKKKQRLREMVCL